MGFDFRTPLGVMFAILGLLPDGFGLRARRRA